MLQGNEMRDILCVQQERTGQHTHKHQLILKRFSTRLITIASQFLMQHASKYHTNTEHY